MNDRIKTAFDGIKAEEALKTDTKLFLLEKAQKTVSKREVRFSPRIAVVSLSVLFIGIMFSAVYYNLYFRPGMYIDLDVNPSVEFVVNPFKKVIGVYSFNTAGEEVVSGIDLYHMDFNAAIEAFIEAAEKRGYIEEDRLISVTLQTENREWEENLPLKIRAAVEELVSGGNESVLIDVFPVSRELRERAREEEITPAKYLAIKELMDIDNTVTFEGCREHSVSSLKKMTAGHNGAGAQNRHNNSRSDSGNRGLHHGRGHAGN